MSYSELRDHCSVEETMSLTFCVCVRVYSCSTRVYGAEVNHRYIFLGHSLRCCWLFFFDTGSPAECLDWGLRADPRDPLPEPLRCRDYQCTTMPDFFLKKKKLVSEDQTLVLTWQGFYQLSPVLSALWHSQSKEQIASPMPSKALIGQPHCSP